MRWLLIKTSTNLNVDILNVDKPKRRQTQTSTDRNVDRPKRWQTKTSTNQTVNKPKRRQTKTSTERQTDWQRGTYIHTDRPPNEHTWHIRIMITLVSEFPFWLNALSEHYELGNGGVNPLEASLSSCVRIYILYGCIEHMNPTWLQLCSDLWYRMLQRRQPTHGDPNDAVDHIISDRHLTSSSAMPRLLCHFDMALSSATLCRSDIMPEIEAISMSPIFETTLTIRCRRGIWPL